MNTSALLCPMHFPTSFTILLWEGGLSSFPPTPVLCEEAGAAVHSDHG